MVRRATFYFYDLETSGFNPREARVMQFGGQRTDMNLKPIGNPHNIYIQLTDDVLPDPDAVLVTGITPQQTRADGIIEAEFLKIFHREIALPGTIFTGFNTVRFDDEFMRYLNYRNFYDPYEWQWQDGRSRWDLLDVARMTRAIRPEGIKWPFDSEGKPSNRLELLADVNKLGHVQAHDALNDVMVSIALARLIRNKQPKLFEYLLKMRDKKEVDKLANSGQPFLYTSGKYPSEFEKTTVVTTLARHPKRQGVLVYDLRQDPKQFLDMKPEKLAAIWQWQQDPDAIRLPVKTLQFNRCPAVAPLGGLEDSVKKRLGIDMNLIAARQNKVKSKVFIQNVLKALEILDKQQQARLFTDEQLVDGQLYDGFYDNPDKQAMRLIRAAEPEELGELTDKFKDARLKALLPLYKARNFPNSLTSKERESWDTYRFKKLMEGGENSRLASYFEHIEGLRRLTSLTEHQQYLLTELELYGQSIMPAP